MVPLKKKKWSLISQIRRGHLNNKIWLWLVLQVTWSVLHKSTVTHVTYPASVFFCGIIKRLNCKQKWLLWGTPLVDSVCNTDFPWIFLCRNFPALQLSVVSEEMTRGRGLSNLWGPHVSFPFYFFIFLNVLSDYYCHCFYHSL